MERGKHSVKTPRLRLRGRGRNTETHRDASSLHLFRDLQAHHHKSDQHLNTHPTPLLLAVPLHLLLLFLLLPVAVALGVRVLGHGVDLALGRVEHDGEDLQVAQQPHLAEARALAALAHQQLRQARPVDGLLGLGHAMLLKVGET